jgi:hypothetical protein
MIFLRMITISAAMTLITVGELNVSESRVFGFNSPANTISDGRFEQSPAFQRNCQDSGRPSGGVYDQKVIPGSIGLSQQLANNDGVSSALNTPVEPASSTAGKNLSANQAEPLSVERKNISELIERARQKGTNVSNYEMTLHYLEDRIHSGASPDSLKGTVEQLTTHLNDDINGVKHTVVIEHSPAASGGTFRPNGFGSQKSGAEQYAQEMKRLKENQDRDYKRSKSKDFWQKVHDESNASHYKH